jgi:hypothetical protein
VTEAENVPGRPIAAALAGTVLVIAICAAIVWWLVGRTTGTGARAAATLTQPSSQPFSEPLRGEAERAAARAQLDTWSWADAAHTRVRLPVSVAIDRYLEAP